MALKALSRPPDEAGAAWPAIAMGFFVAFGGVLYGYDTGTISGIMAMRAWKDLFSTGFRNPAGELDITTTQESGIVSILSAGTFFGALASPFLADWCGRRPGLLISTWVFNLGVVLQTVAEAIPLFLAGRFFAGLGVGLISALIPLYQSETAPKWIRGAIVGSYQLAITIGLLLASAVDNATSTRPDTGSYRIPIAVQFAWSLVLFGGMLVLPETPRFLVRADRADAAAAALARIRRLPASHPAVAAELADITASLDYERAAAASANHSNTLLACFRPPVLRRQLTGMALQALQQLSGVNFIFYYGTRFFENSGVSSGFTISMITSAINVVSSFPGLWFADRWGRRPLLLYGAVGMAAAQLIVAICGTLSTGQLSDGSIVVHNLAGQRAAVSFVCVYIFCFAASWGPLAWVVTGEIFPLSTRAVSLSITTATNWLVNWAIAYSTPYLVNFGPGFANLQSKIFFVWFGACFLCVVFVFFCIYETKGLTLEEVDQLYNECPSARHSTAWTPSDVGARSSKKMVDEEEEVQHVHDAAAYQTDDAQA
ncbi:putative glucose transporter rco-3 [Escovopsis weberi]|uniref:Putative glucose transporter rco-3 n=1 Tax=Escovopsis weberi TaxID=150374 RepID=A0A0M9VUM7_ESCWE|nr:putative glucose transporter rco-3 [Escovopsis weberi]